MSSFKTEVVDVVLSVQFCAIFIVNSSLEILQDALHGAEVRLPRVMHVKTDLLNGISNIRASESEILEGPSYAAIMGGVRHRGPHQR